MNPEHLRAAAAHIARTRPETHLPPTAVEYEAQRMVTHFDPAEAARANQAAAEVAAKQLSEYLPHPQRVRTDDGHVVLTAAQAEVLSDVLERWVPATECDFCGARGAEEVHRDEAHGDGVLGVMRMLCRGCA